MAAEFDRVHSVQRALAVGTLNSIIPPANLWPSPLCALRTHSAQSVRLDTMLRALLALSRVLPVLDWLPIQE
jgi:hypothetical protein